MKKTVINEVAIFIIAATILLIAAWHSESFVPSGFKKDIFKSSPIERRDNMYGVTHAGDNLIWIVGNIGKIARSRDGGKTWDSPKSGINYNLQDIAAWDEKRLVAVGNEGVLIVSEDGGDTWIKKNVPKSEVANKLIRVKTQDGGKAWACGIMGVALYTDDYGNTWRRRVPEEDVAFNDIAFATDLIGVIACEFGKVKRTEDGGETWTDISTPVGKSLIAVDFNEEGVGIIVGLEGTVLRSADYGLTWALIDAGTTQHLFDITHYNGHWVGIGNKGIIITSSDSGVTWESKQLSKTELLWHTGITRLSSSKMIIVGGTQGIYDNGNWNYLF
jgi:photosystem II stability/assembly factor-like uncharacterized protein